ncbi:DUF2004 domain-containing protein [Hyunsoonleella flava]|uniref:DUF2004 domain-containing protein n=1 Tax=Hyunsoonleella flava TaxID=2527939 RepID=A0A4Q9FCJ8_9FLAO|nr:DUF2004 domain-containing protein [Hyunsoonleella flava]TBN02645.1 DUF2004 domain-containing protein [Hyunsoonleella flava]
MGIFDFFRKTKKEDFDSSLEKIRTIESPDFSEIDTENLKDYYDWTLNFGDRKINLDLNFETVSTDQLKLSQILNFIHKIPDFEKQNRSYIKTDFEQKESMTSDYLNFYLDELTESELAGIIGKNVPIKSRLGLLMKKLNLVRVGVYPQASPILELSITQLISMEILVIKF